MEIKGCAIGFVDVPQEYTQDFNRWYDFDHIPENLALPEIVAAKRYVATPDCQALRPGSEYPALKDGAGAYFTIYYFGTGDMAQAQKSWGALGQEMREAKRMFRYGRVPYAGVYRMEFLKGRGDIPVRPSAIPYVAHQGVLVVFAQVPDPAQRDEVNEWYRDVHAVDLLEVPGIAATMRYHRHESPDEGHYMNLYLLDGDPVGVVQEIGRRRPEWERSGRMPLVGTASFPYYQSAYRAIAPLEYDFRVE